jgi:hypothetical protein
MAVRLPPSGRRGDHSPGEPDRARDTLAPHETGPKQRGAMMSDPNIYPVLRYADAGKALEWLAKAFGFKENVVVRGDDGTVNHAQMSLVSCAGNS